jgi:hypothetical protein
MDEVNESINNVKISIEQICAAIINTVGKVEVSLENMMKDYSNLNIAVSQNEETNNLTFELTEIPQLENQAENE